MKVYVIMGKGDTRKSSTIRALTGIGVCNVYEVAFKDRVSPKLMLICPQALQEAKISPGEFLEKAEKMKEKGDFNEILIALRVRGIKEQPDGIVYLKKFEKEGWEIVNPIFLLGEEKEENLEGLRKKYIIEKLENAPQMASNEIATKIRPKWGFK